MLSTLLAVLVSAAPTPAGALSGVELRWDAPAACPDESALRQQVEAILGAPLDAARPRPLSVIAVVRDDGTTRSLRIFTVTGDGMHERALRYDRDCALLTRAAAVLIAITIDPTSLGRLDPAALALLEPTSTPEPPPTTATSGAASAPEPAPVREPASVTAPVHEPPPTRAPRAAASPVRPPWRPRGALRVFAGVALGEMPAVGGGLGGAAALVFRHLRLELAVSLWPARRARISGTEAGADFLLWTLGPRVCGVVHPHRLLEVPLCLGLEAGRIRVTGVRLADDRSDRAAWVAAVLAPSLVVAPLRRLALWFAPELLVPATRTIFTVEEAGPIWRAQPVAGRLTLGVELRFP